MEAKKIFIMISLILVMSIALAAVGIAYAGGVRAMGLLGVCFFVTFGIVVVMGQLIPAGILLSSFIGTASSPFRKNELRIRVA